ncbi:hypothetical protein [Streptomyces sp. S.PB5]|uniref:hypothetical protein n=1 Tax=Streptomyces sp. S.PB5 TaxID=3020844 RepID=UPI0025B22AED|nr:hypothetical protein [Streptomyces sp. S.PB5]MDN3029418.1 hypothetical protein [Streptomyces sp. S.PB5]
MADRRKTANTALRQVRERQFQMSRHEFAKRIVTTGEEMGESVGCTARLVAAWEDGDVECPRGVYRRILTRMTGRTMEQLGFRPLTPSASALPALAPNAPNAPNGENKSAVPDRRAFLADTAGAAVALLPVLTATGERPPGRIGMRNVHAVHQAVSALYAHDHDHGSATLRQQASEALHTAYGWLQDGQLADRTERHLRSATGHLSIRRMALL